MLPSRPLANAKRISGSRRRRFVVLLAAAIVGASIASGALIAENWDRASLASRLAELDRTPRPDPTQFERGAEVYLEAGCQRCHSEEPTSPDNDLAPSLGRLLYRYSASEVLDHVVEPDRFVGERYRTVIVDLRGGQTREGLLVEETDQYLLLMPSPLEPALRHRIAKAVIKRRDTLTVSPMPDGLLDPFSADDVIALLSYLLFVEEP